MNNENVREIHLNDRLVSKDNLNQVQNAFKKGVHKKTFRTEITAMNEFGEILFTHEENETVLGGALTVLEKLAGIKAPLKVASINSILGINDLVDIADSSAIDDDILCLWGVGIGGSGDAFGSRKDVKFYEREVGENGHTNQMIPFRVVAQPFSDTDDNSAKYFMLNRRESDGLYEYYLKAFETDPEIKVLWKDGAEGEDGSEVGSDVYATTRTQEIEVFLEIHLQISKRDIREYFEALGEIEMARVNTIALFTARKEEIEANYFDYTNVKMFSKLNFDNEPLQNAKTISFIYRIYVS